MVTSACVHQLPLLCDLLAPDFCQWFKLSCSCCEMIPLLQVINRVTMLLHVFLVLSCQQWTHPDYLHNAHVLTFCLALTVLLIRTLHGLLLGSS